MPDPASQRCALWILRILDRVSDHPALRDRLRHLPRETVAACGLPEWHTRDGHRFRRIRARRRQLERTAREPLGAPLDRVQVLADVLGLAPAERDLLAFFVAAAAFEAIPGAIRELEPLWPHTRHALIAAALARPIDEIHRALAPDGALQSSGLLEIERFHGTTLAPNERLLSLILATYDDEPLLTRLFPAVPTPTLARADLDHLGAHVDRLVALLSRAVRDRVRGFDVLLVGPPGTGKTQLARWLVAHLGLRGLQVPVIDEGRAAHGRDGRLRHWALAQRFAARSERAVVVFDEAEDAFPSENPFQPASSASKGWFTHHLDTHPVPTVWIANRIEHLDPAYLRRFDLVLQVEVPPPSVRRRLVDAAIASLPIDAPTREALADDPRLSPAHLDRAARALRLLDLRGADDAADALEALLQPQLGFVGPRPARATRTRFDPSLSTASHDLDALAEALARTGRGAVLLHGPPGTGKTHWARHVAERAHRPLVACSPSSVLGSFVGETERQLAAAFDRARRDGAVLLLDEVDSLLFDRAGAQRSWEVSQVNELLVQLDRFDGVVLCATNRLDALDPAALRRFAVKVRFEPPDRAARRRLVESALRELGAPPAPDALLARVDALEGLTPGDVEAARRQLALLGTPDGHALVARLEEERRPVRRLGFQR